MTRKEFLELTGKAAMGVGLAGSGLTGLFDDAAAQKPAKPAKPFTLSAKAQQAIQKVYRHIEENKQRHIARLQEYLRQPSVSAQHIGIERCAEMLAGYYRDLDCQEVEMVKTDGNPGIWAYYDCGVKGAKTIVNYSMYDVQPVEEKEWTTPPFAAELVKMDPFPLVLRARGAINSKGSYRMWLNALESIIAVEGKLPVNIMFTAEGEEELGSPHFHQIIEQYADRLKTANAVLNPDPTQALDGSVTMSLGNKGIVYFELECSGTDWGRGPTQREIHSSFKAAVDSPVWRLLKALSSMTSEDGNSIMIEHFYDRVAPPSQEDEALLAELVKTFNVENWRKANAVDVFIDNAEGIDLLKKYLYSTTLNLDGIWAGYTGPGTKTILPHKATCKIDVRLVPNQEAKDIIPLIRAHLDKHGFTDIKIRQLSGYEWSKTSVTQPVVQAVLNVYQKNNIRPVIWPHTGGSAPFYLYTRPPLSLPTCGGGMGHGARAHSVDEYIVIDGNDRVAGIAEAEKSFVDILYTYAEWKTT
ncbi:MAG: M20/M25/M40 family metallo-hydrolase [Candidatus Latescibacteria bacterium]|nr:M20/M25/M40 family metallo-hydrolase [Candidatus Latescibacterota bacterium]